MLQSFQEEPIIITLPQKLFYVCLSVCLFVCLSFYLSVCDFLSFLLFHLFSVFLIFCLLFVRLSVYFCLLFCLSQPFLLFRRQFLYLFGCLSLSLFLFFYFMFVFISLCLQMYFSIKCSTLIFVCSSFRLFLISNVRKEMEKQSMFSICFKSLELQTYDSI